MNRAAAFALRAAADTIDAMPPAVDQPSPPPRFALELGAAPRAVAADGRVLALAPLDAALLAWLALEGPTPRARLAQLLWPDKDAEAARNSLRQRLFQLRKQAGADLVAGSATVSLADGVTHDLDQADGVLAAVPHAFGAELTAWLEQQRDRRRRRMQRSLAELAEMAEAAKDFDDALSHANELLTLEPLSEDAHRRVMRLHYLRGDRAAALLAFDACERLLKDEVGARPSAETLTLLDTVQRVTLPSRAVASRLDAALLRPPRLVGRDGEWAELERAVDAGRLVLIEGEGGLGKSRLVGDFARRMPAAAIAAGARPGDASVPYACLVRLLRGLIERVGEPPAALKRTLSRLLPEFGDPGPVFDERTRLHAALEAFVVSARGVELIVVDDLHLADAASVEALAFLAEAPGSPAWVFAARPAEPSGGAPSHLSRLLSGGRMQRIALQPLTVPQIAELVDLLAVPGWVGAELAPRLARHTGGNPQFLLETLKSLPVDASTTALPVVRTVTQLVGQRLRRLSPEAVRIARCAALAGPDFSVELATHLLRIGPLDLADAWAELEAAHVLRDQAFAHDLIREAAQASVPAPLARQLHREIAAYLEQRGAASERIADHWRAGGQSERAVPHLLEAGRRAVTMLRWEEAVDALMQAADLLERGGDRGAAFDAINALFEHVRAPGHGLWQRPLQRLQDLADTPVRRATAAERQAGALTQRGDFASAGALAEAALGWFHHEQALGLAVALLVQHSSGQLQAGRSDEAVRLMYRAVALAEASGDEAAQHRAVAALGVALNVAGRSAEAEPHFVRALEIAKRSGKPLEIVEAAIELASLRTSSGHLASARSHFEHAEQVVRSHDLDADRIWPWMALQRVGLALLQGRFREAVQALEGAAAVLAAHMPAWRIALDNRATPLWMQLGQWARARQSSEAALSRCDGALPMYVAQARLHAIELDLAQGRRGAALVRVDAALAELGAASPRAALQLQCLRTSLVDPPTGLAAAREAGAHARTRGMLGLALDAEVAACEAALRGTDAAAACSHARAALSLAESVEPTMGYRGQVWLSAVRALIDVERPLALRTLRIATRWLDETAQHQMPPEFRDSFVHRNPVNRELLALAARLTPR